jgi:hypothetical protein
MSMIRYGAKLNVLLVTKGHPFARDAFHALFDAIPDCAVTAVEHPAAELFFSPALAAPYDAIVLYDMPGIDFAQRNPLGMVAPSEALKRGWRTLLASGKGIVFLHHAVAAWPLWPEYGEWTGARFLYAPGEAFGKSWPDSGYRHDVKHRVTPVDPKHPLFAGIEGGYEISDELYLCPVLEERVTPLARSSHAFVPENFYSSAQAIAGKMFSNAGWSHPRGSNLAAWSQRVGKSQTATILGGDGPVAYENPGFRRLVENAIRWVAEETRKRSDGA